MLSGDVKVVVLVSPRRPSVVVVVTRVLVITVDPRTVSVVEPTTVCK